MANGKKRVGGALILGAAVWIGQESFAWFWNRVLDLASKGVSGVTVAAFPWQSTLATVMAIVGAYLAFWPSKRTGKPKPANPADKFYMLWADAGSYIDRVRYQRGLEWHERSRGVFNRAEDARDIARDGISLLLRFEKDGLPIPHFDTNSAEKISVGCSSYFEHLSSFMRDGHTDHVVAMAPTAAKNAEKIAHNFNANHWYSDAQEGY